MRLDSTQKVDHFDLSFEVVQPGISVAQFLEGIEKKTHEKSGKTTLKMPLVVHQVVDGPAENEGKKFIHFCPIETDFGERQLASLLSMAGLLDYLAKKFAGDFSPLDDKFVNTLALKLPGKFIQVRHDLKKDQKGKDQTNIIRFEMPNGGAEKSTKPPQKGKQPAAEEEDF